MLLPLAYLDVRCNRGVAGLLRRRGVSFGLRERCGGIQHVDRWPGPGCLTGALGQALLLLPAEVAPWRPEAGWLKMERRHATLGLSVCRELPQMMMMMTKSSQSWLCVVLRFFI